MDNMKVTIVKINQKHQRRLRLLAVDEMVGQVTDGAYGETIAQLREFVGFGYEYADFKYMYRLPVVLPSSEMKLDEEHNELMRRFNGLLTLTIGPVAGEDEARAVKQVVAALPMTMLAVTGSSGRTVKVVVSVANQDGTLPQHEDEARQLLRRACQMVCRLYEVAVSMLPSSGVLAVGPALRKGDDDLLHTGFRMTFDEHPVFRPEASPLLVPEGVALDPQRMPATLKTPLATTEDKGAAGQETRQLIDFLESNYVFRMNKVLGYVEYHPKQQWYLWQPVDERAQNTMAMEARLAGLNVWDKDVSRYVKSNMVRNYNPIDDYLWEVRDTWDGRDYIGRLARTVPTANPHWPRWFRTWFLAMVAQWTGRNPRYGNALAPLLISRQGYNKSTFCKSLLPPELQWGYNDNLVLSEKKSVLQAMSQFLLINLDEFNQISPKVQEGFLKNLIQLASVKVKRPYGKHVEDFPRLASFIATANVTDILADPSGNRRFIGIELTGPIDVSHRINYRQLYAQAMTLLGQGEPCWLDEEQTRLVMQSNRQFQLRAPEELFFNECFDIVGSDSATIPDNAQWLTAAAIFQRVKQRAGSAIRYGNVRNFGRFLSNLDGLKRRRTSIGMEYHVVPR